jgi:hypothetical protein
MRSRIIDKALASVSDQQQNLTSMTSLAAEVCSVNYRILFLRLNSKILYFLSARQMSCMINLNIKSGMKKKFHCWLIRSYKRL